METGKPHLFKEKLHKKVALSNNYYPVYRQGEGSVPSIGLGVGTTLLRTFSEEFYEHFTFYSADTYWVSSHPHTEPEKVSMDDIIEDFNQIMEDLKLVKPLVFAHSCFGIVALEAAKRKGHNMGGIVLVASPPKWDEELIAHAQRHFDENASEERKLNHKIRQEQYEKRKKPGDSIINLNAYEADSAKYWGDFRVSHDILKGIWEGIEAEDRMMNQFFDVILPNHDLAKNIEDVDIPVLLVAGKCDYDSIPLEAWREYPKPSNFTVVDCGEVGHWPHYECPQVFDKALINWLNNIVIKPQV